MLLRDGSSPLAGAFTLAARGEVTDALAWDQGALEVESELEELSSIGDVSVRSSLASLQRIPGAWATLGRDATAASVEYDADFEGYDLRDWLAPGEAVRIGGDGVAPDGALPLPGAAYAVPGLSVLG